MKFKFSLLIMLFCFLSCQETVKKKDQLFPEKHDTLLVRISDNIILKWDKKSNSLIKDEDYVNILKDKKKIYSVMNFIKEKENLAIKICSKKSANLKNGDIAFTYLYENQRIPAFRCFNFQFDFIENKCQFPEGLLDYLEENRQETSEKIHNCISD